ncbi:MAG: MFS transporter [Pseudomonadales bacterium]|nr:MFS transporter [Pseudomonadales bacterium]
MLPWLFSGLGVPTFFTGLLVPLRESGSLLPQLLVGGAVRRYARRKGFFVAGCVLQAGAVAGMALVALFYRGSTAGWLILALLVLFSLARALCSVVAKDVLGKTIPKKQRGRIGGYSASAAGLITIGIGLALLLDWRADNGQYIALLVLAASCWLAAALIYATVQEPRGESSGSASAVRNALANLALLKDDALLRRFVIVRGLMMSSGLAAPFFILLARDASTGSALLELGLFVALGGLAGLVSGPLWGKLADRSSRRVMLHTAAANALVCALASALPFLGGQVFGGQAVVALAMALFFILSLVHQGVRLGRKTYLVNLAQGNRRTDYVSVSNTVIGILLLVVGFAAALVAQYSLTAVLLLLALSSALAVLVGRSMPEA